MKRRRFLKALFQAGLLLGPLRSLAAARTQPAGRAQLAVAEHPDPVQLVAAVVDKLGGMGRFVKPGQRVVVKPNIGWDRTPAEAANTHPVVVAELCRLARAAGADTVTVFDRTCNDARRTYVRSGIEDAVAALGDDRVRLDHVRDALFRVEQLPGAVTLTRWPLYGPALDADVLINVPVVKHHGLTGVTVGMKNLMGVMGGNRGRVHSGIDDNLVDLNLAVRSHLTVVDATRILLRNGPQGGGTRYVRNAQKLAASTDVVAADAWGAREFGSDAAAVGHLVQAGARGLGETDLDRVTIL